MAPQHSIKVYCILRCSTTALLGLAGQVSKFCGPDKIFLGLFSIFRVHMQRGVAHALGKARPHGRPGRRGAGRRSGLRPYPPLGAARSFSIVAPSPRANRHYLAPPIPSLCFPSIPSQINPPFIPLLGVPSYNLGVPILSDFYICVSILHVDPFILGIFFLQIYVCNLN